MIAWLAEAVDATGRRELYALWFDGALTNETCRRFVADDRTIESARELLTYYMGLSIVSEVSA